MDYNDFISNALKNYEAMPYEANELYKRQGIGFDLAPYEKALSSGAGSNESLKGFAEAASSKLKTKFDAVIGDGKVIYCSVPGLTLSSTESVYDTISKCSMYRSSEDKFVAFANAFAKDAVLLRIGQSQKTALNILFVYGATVPPLQLYARVEAGAHAVLNEVFASKDGNIMSGIMQEITLGANSSTEVNVLHVENGGTKSFGMLKASAEENSALVVNNLYSGSGMSRHRGGLLSKGRGAQVDFNDIILGAEEQKFDLYTEIINEGPESRCSAETKAVALDKSAVIVKGMAKVIHGSRKSISYLKEKGILYDKGTQIKMMPDMSIDESDVKATHSSSVAPIDEDSLFYLGARGLAHDDAKRVIVDGFVLGSISKIGDTHARVLATAMAIGKLRDRVIGLREIEARDAWADTNESPQQSAFAGSYKYQYRGDLK